MVRKNWKKIMMSEKSFIVVRGQNDNGCYYCDPPYSSPDLMTVNSNLGIADVVNMMHDIMEKKLEHNYPLTLNRVDEDGEIEFLCQFELDAGCLSGLKEVSFRVDNMVYRVKRGKRKS
jgi:hypothetical protein